MCAQYDLKYICKFTNIILFSDNTKKENKHQQIQLLQYMHGLVALSIGQSLITLLN